MKRREALRTISIGAGIAVSGVTFSALVSSCQNEPDWLPDFLSLEESQVVDLLLESMLPKTETPGASELGLVRIIDNAVNKLYKAKDQTDFKGGLNEILKRFKSENDLSETDTLKKEHIDKMTAKYFNLPEIERKRLGDLIYTDREEVSDNDMPEYLFAKAMNNLRDLGIGSYFEHETIQTEFLNYDPIPTRWDGCIPVSNVGNTWSI